jgi:predicted nuclease of predicted toxin-antitoxin system
MRMLLDQDVYAVTARFLAQAGHDIVLAAELGLSRAADETVLKAAYDQHRLLVTRDRDFGHLVFVRRLGVGVIYLRIQPSTMTDVHTELARVLERYPEEALHQAFVSVNSKGHRVRRIPRQTE